MADHCLSPGDLEIQNLGPFFLQKMAKKKVRFKGECKLSTRQIDNSFLCIYTYNTHMYDLNFGALLRGMLRGYASARAPPSTITYPVARKKETNPYEYVYIYYYVVNTMYQSIYLSIDLFINQSINLSINLSIYQSIYLSIYVTIYQSIYLSIYQSMYQSTNLSIYQFYQSIYQSIYLSIYQSMYQSTNLSIYQFYQSIYQSINLSIYKYIGMYEVPECQIRKNDFSGHPNVLPLSLSPVPAARRSISRRCPRRCRRIRPGDMGTPYGKLVGSWEWASHHWGVTVCTL